MRLLCILLFLQGTLFSQSELSPIGAVWHYQCKDSESSPFGLGYLKYECVGDSTVNGKLCRQINNYRVRSDSTRIALNPIFVYSQNDTVVRYSPLLDDFYILMDYTAVVGDTLLLRPNYPNVYKDSIL